MTYYRNEYENDRTIMDKAVSVGQWLHNQCIDTPEKREAVRQAIKGLEHTVEYLCLKSAREALQQFCDRVAEELEIERDPAFIWDTIDAAIADCLSPADNDVNETWEIEGV